MGEVMQMLVTFIGTLAASSGFWLYVQKKCDRNDAKTKLLIGLAHDRIMELGMKYIQKKEITKEEYENLHDYLFLPYKENHGNGSAERVMNEVDKLPIV